MPQTSAILGLGAHVPPKVLTNFDLEKMMDTTDEWIRTRTGIRERHIADKSQCASDLGVLAAREALAQAGLSAGQIELIIVATSTPDMIFPSTGCGIQEKLGARCGAFDVSAACSGFTYAVSIADAYVRGGIYRNVLVVGAELLSRFVDWKDRSTCVLFGDGAGAAVIGPSVDGHGILSTYLGSDGSKADLLKIPGGGSMFPPSSETLAQGLHYLKMQGSEIFKIAVRTMEDAVHEVVSRAGLAVSDIACLIPHQANMRILSAVAERLEIPLEKVYVNVEKYGNMSSASTVVALYEAALSGKIKKGDYVVLVAFGGGLTWGSALIKW
ncbi:MAG: beta-ketoacyl-ACP synthase III [Candidatus Omnitrophota bacterium]|jgi:3-oxoacyl-[acyl-carrier-protein] synthase-3